MGSSFRSSHSVISDSLWPHGLQHPGLPVHHQPPEFTLTHVHWVGDAFNHLILCLPLLLLPSIFPSIRVFSNELALHIRWPKYWSFHFSISPSNEYSGLISFRRDWLDLLAVQWTLKSLLQHHNSKASVPRCSAFFTVNIHNFLWTFCNSHCLKNKVHLIEDDFVISTSIIFPLLPNTPLRFSSYQN